MFRGEDALVAAASLLGIAGKEVEICKSMPSAYQPDMLCRLKKMLKNPTAVKPAVKEVSKPQPEEKAGVDKLETALAEHNVSLKYRRDDQTKALIVELVDEKTGEAIRQIPSEVSLKLTARFSKLQGLLLDEQR